MRLRSLHLASIALAACLAAPAAAATYDFDLTGQIANGSTSVFTAGSETFTIFALTLDGFGAPFELAVGDVLNLSVALDGLVTVPASTSGTFFSVDALTAPGEFALLDPGVISSGSISPLDGTFAGQTFFSACSNCIAATAGLGPSPAFDIGTLTASITIESLALLDPADTSPVTLNGFQFRYQSADVTVAAVPEPATWAMMLAGFGAVGMTLRRKTGIRLARAAA